MTRTVHLVDDDAGLREALVDRLRGTGLAVTAYASPAQVIEASAALRPPAVLLSDVFMPEMTGLEMLDRLRDAGVDVPVVFMTGFGDVPLAVDAMRRGAVTFLEKPVGAAALDKALAAAFEAAEATGPAAGLDALSDRERAVLGAAAEGTSVKRTAIALGISPKTVEHHRTRIKVKLGAGSFDEAAALWRERGGGV
jgi:FixJ family two-component response regulator